MSDIRIIRIQLVDPENKEILRSADSYPASWMKMTEMYDRLQRALSARATKGSES